MFSFFKTKKHDLRQYKGFSLVEIVVTLGILAIVSAIVLSSLSSNTDREALAKNADAAASVLTEARSLTISSKSASNYGVRLTSVGPTLFTGTTYNASASSNRSLALNARVSITNISLTGGGSDVVFSKLTGNTSQNGTFRVALVSNPSVYKTVTIYKTGLVEVQ